MARGAISIRRRSLLAVVGAVCLLAAAVPGSAQKLGPSPRSVSKAEIPAFEITGTARGTAYAAQTAQRWAEKHQVYRDVATLRVYDFGTAEAPDLFVASPAIQIESATIERLADGSVKVAGEVVVDPSKLTRAGSLGTAYWTQVADDCFAREENGTGWMDTCYKMYQLVGGDGSSTYDYYALNHWATAKSKSVWTLKKIGLEAKKHSSSSTMYWSDWSPKADQTVGGCKSTTVSVTVYGVGLSSTSTICDKWDIGKFSDAGHFSNTWFGSAWRSERYVEYLIAVKVPQYGWPVWSLYDTFYCT